MQAYIGRIEPVSGDHWHGGLATAIFFAGCDYNCPNCNTPDILDTKEEFQMELREIKNQLKQYSSNIKAVVFTGGEPCLQRPALLSLATFAKDIDLKTGLETNGSKPEVIRTLLSLGLIDQLALDLKSPFIEENYERATKSRTFFKNTHALIDDVKKTITILEKYQKQTDIEVRTTITPTLIARKEDVYKIGQAIEHLDCTFVLQRFKPELALNKRLEKLNPPSVEFMENLRVALVRKFPKIRVSLDSGDF